jgi:hypothetical protein
MVLMLDIQHNLKSMDSDGPFYKRIYYICYNDGRYQFLLSRIFNNYKLIFGLEEFIIIL